VLYLNSADLPVNKGLLDARNTGRVFADLADAFYPVEFFDLCTIIEQIVLRDEIVLVGKFGRLPRDHVRALQPFIDDGVFKICVEAFPIGRDVATDTDLRMLAHQTGRARLTSGSLVDADYAVTRLLGAEIALKIPTTPLLQHLHNYQFFRRPILDNTACDIVARYSDLADRAQRLKELDFRRCALRPIPIPPIALQVIQRSHNFEKLREQILQTRRDYRNLRDQMTMLMEMMSDPSLTSSKFFQLADAWDRRWNKLADLSLPSIMQVGSTAVPLLAGGKELATAYKSGSTIGTVVAGVKLFSAVGSVMGGLTLRPVHLSVQNYLKTHPHHMIGAASRVFETDPLRVKRLMEAVGGTTQSVWRAALAKL